MCDEESDEPSIYKNTYVYLCNNDRMYIYKHITYICFAKAFVISSDNCNVLQLGHLLAFMLIITKIIVRIFHCCFTRRA